MQGDKVNPKLTPEEIRILRKQVHGTGNLAKLGLIVVTEAGRQFIAQDDARILKDKSRAGTVGGPARADALTDKQLRKIAAKGGRAAAARKAAEQ